MTQRKIVAVRASQPSRDGDGVAINRVSLMGDPGTDPVLLVDELRSPFREDFAGGFPPHPHRGMQTLTYMKDGGIIHEDSMGNRGEIRSGGAQWMSAGSGVIHSEMPTQDTQGLHGFQLWFNLPAAEKMAPPRYRDIPHADLTHHIGDGFRASVVAGDWVLNGEASSGPLHELAAQGSLLDLDMNANTTLTLTLPETDTALAYIYAGDIIEQSAQIPSRHLVIVGPGTTWQISSGEQGAGLLVMTGRPIREPVVGYGPFVMNTREEIDQAIRDYQAGVLVQRA